MNALIFAEPFAVFWFNMSLGTQPNCSENRRRRWRLVGWELRIDKEIVVRGRWIEYGMAYNILSVNQSASQPTYQPANSLFLL